MKTRSTYEGVGRVMGSMLGPNRVIAKDVKPTTAMSDARHYSISRGEYLGPKQAQLSTVITIIDRGFFFLVSDAYFGLC